MWNKRVHKPFLDATRTEYTYDSMYRLISTTAKTDQSKTMSVGYGYSSDLLTQVTTGSSVYNFTYGDFSSRTKVAVGSTTLASYTYTDDAYHRLQSVTYGNGDKVEYTYDDLGRVTKEIYKENGSSTVSRTITYEYDNSGALATMVDSKTGITTKYYYDTVGRSTGMYESGGSSTHSLKYTYDGLGRLQKTTETGGNSTYTTEYGYYGNGQVSAIKAGSSTEVYVYDEYNRLDQWQTYHGSSSTALITKNIHYEAPDDRSTSSWPVVWSYTSSGGYGITYNYGYDANGDIVSEKVDGKTTTYVYDSANQLIRENNQAAGKTWVWTYDDAGNILSKTEYVYTTGTLGSVEESYTYTYGNSNWGDLLTSYNGANITYDAIGNPLSDGTWTYEWEEGRKLAKMTRGSTTWTYTYDANGMRTKRINGSTTYNYIYHGDQLTHMTYGSNVLHFYYDASGKPLSVVYNGTTYYYVLNLQGDVVALLDSSGNQVVGYSYDAWGNPITLSGSMSTTLGFHNPLRYRGYVYDRETGLYYLQSRYYNPEIGRFINADSLVSTGQGILGYNMFAYCMNNPINMTDENGYLPSWATKLLIGTAVIAAAAILTVATAGSGTALACFAVGALKGSVVGALAGAASGAATGAISHRIQTGSWEGAGEAALNGAADGYMGGAISGFISGGLTSNVCFVAGTVVLTEIGKVAIEEIVAGDYVWASDSETGEVALKRVVQTFVNESNELIHVEVDGEKIVCTKEHPFYSPVKGWMAACDLRAGDILVTVKGEYVVVEKVQHEILESPVAVYNFEVEDFHTYYVGDTNVLVHNMCKPKNIYNSIKDAPNYNANFVKAQNGLQKVNVNNQELLQQLNQLGSGWKKVYQNGWINGQKASLHYFQDASGKIFDFAIKHGRWS